MSTHDQEKKTAQHDAAQKQECCSHDQANKTAQQDAAFQTQGYHSNPFESQLVSMADHKLVMTNKEGKECSHTLAKDAKITSDGTASKEDHLLAGNKIRVTTKNDDRNVATCIEALDKHTEFAKSST